MADLFLGNGGIVKSRAVRRSQGQWELNLIIAVNLNCG